MKKHLLVAVSDQYASSLSLRFVHDFFTNRDDVELTLYYVAPRGPQETPGVQLLGGCPTPPIDPSGVPALEKARTWLLEMGFPAANLHVKVTRGDLGVVKDIIKESEEGLYDAAVLGRRGVSWFEEMFTDSVSHKILWEALTFPIWVCRNPAKGRKNVLVCLDDTPGSLHVTDHAAFMLRGEPGHDLTLFRVETGRGEPGEAIFERHLAVVRENAFPEERVRFLTVISKDPVKAILKEAENYAAVAIGRTSGRPRALDHLFGTTSLKILRSLEGAALWLSK